MGKSTPLKVALLGCGVVGSQVARLLIQQADDLRARTIGDLATNVLVVDPDRK